MRQLSSLLGLAAVIAGLAACTEPHQTAGAMAPSPALEARLELSDSAPHSGESLAVRVRLNGTSAKGIVSFTGRLAYDSTMLRYVADLPTADGATRVTNPAAGLIRSAGVSVAGFADGLLIEYRFVVVNPQGVSRLVLGIDELHDQSHADASRTVLVRRTLGAGLP